jgi:hypothetical protein
LSACARHQEEVDRSEIRSRNMEQLLAADDHVRRLTRKATALEINELVLRRRCASLEEAAASELASRLDAERALVEAEAELKTRLLYLEEWKLGASERLERQAAALEGSRRVEDFAQVFSFF